ncbi:uncharacterized protein LOC114325753 [Diabrotica virgifera virgifera]|uniref:Uncharacterized protein LOC114325753 n=1 Tax=Diabrotica virgifera virgifera TaxID=50390 RepID=A0A6P7F235_DIAVI|nr:uncharacterized protein LOC114325753 [Diabrotica virgifera virgifera]
MFSTMFKNVLFLTILVLIAIPKSQANDYNKCPQTSHQRTLVYDNTLTGRVIHVRIPGSGFFNAPITCLQVLDMAESFSDPEIEEGGYGKEYVVLRIDSVQAGEELEYHVQIYVDE